MPQDGAQLLLEDPFLGIYLTLLLDFADGLILTRIDKPRYLFKYVGICVHLHIWGELMPSACGATPT